MIKNLSRTLLNKRQSYQFYQAKENSGEEMVLLKLIEKDYLSPRDIAGIYAQYELLKSLDLKSVPRPREVIREDSGIALVMDNISGKLLKELKKLTITEILQLGIDLADIIAKLHQEKVIHKDI